MITRRSFTAGTLAFFAAPALVKAAAVREMRVEASYQCGSLLIVEPLPRALMHGDILTIEGVFAHVRAIPDECTRLRQFVVTADAFAGHRIIHLYPQIVPEPDRYATVKQLPMRGASIRR